MADRTSAKLFGRIFNILAENPDERNIKLAAKIWQLTQYYDFHPCQMEIDYLKLFDLELAKDAWDPKTEEENIIYKGWDYGSFNLT